MALTRPFAIDAAFPNALDARKQFGGAFPRQGLFPDPITTAAAGVAYAGTGWGIDARAFTYITKRGGAPYSQTYGVAFGSNDAVVTGAWTIDPAPVSGSRIDLLWIRATDAGSGDSMSGAPTDGPGGAARAVPVFGVTTGAPDSLPVAPSLPAGAVEIARATTPSGAVSAAGSTITQTYTFAQVAGGPIYVRTIAERDALADVIPGDVAIIATTGLQYRRTATTWRGLTIVSGNVNTSTNVNGIVTITHNLGDASAQITVTSGPLIGLDDAAARLFQPIVWQVFTNTAEIRFIRRDDNTYVGTQPVRFTWYAKAP